MDLMDGGVVLRGDILLVMIFDTGKDGGKSKKDGKAVSAHHRFFLTRLLVNVIHHSHLLQILLTRVFAQPIF